MVPGSPQAFVNDHFVGLCLMLGGALFAAFLAISGPAHQGFTHLMNRRDGVVDHLPDRNRFADTDCIRAKTGRPGAHELRCL